MARKIVTVDEGLHLPTAVRNQLKADVESDLSALVTSATTAAGTAQSSSTAAVTARNEAVAAEETIEDTISTWALNTSDSAVAALFNNASTTRTAADARYATSAVLAGKASTADLNTAITTLQAQTASIEDLFVQSTMIAHGNTWPAAAASTPLFTAPFPLTITAASLAMWYGTSIATSDTNYWSFALTKYSITGVGTAIATKTTRTTAGGGLPAGAALNQRQPWTFDSAGFVSANLAAGETLGLVSTPTGTPGSPGAPFIATIGYRPL